MVVLMEIRPCCAYTLVDFNMTRTHCVIYRRMEPVEVVIVYTPVNSHI